MKLSLKDLLYVFSYSLHCVENDYFETSSFHRKRVAYLCMLLGKSYHLNAEEMNDLIGCAILHDNGLIEYYKSIDMIQDNESLKKHCEIGEKNITHLPFFKHIENVILYHHEMINGEGPFAQRGADIPFFSQLIHIADYADVHYDLAHLDQQSYQQMMNEIGNLGNIRFDKMIVKAFQTSVTYENIQKIEDDLEDFLDEHIQNIYQDFSGMQLIPICYLFAHIIDSKSPYTKSHSIGVASKAFEMASYYEYNDERRLEIFFAGTIHDIGKLVIDRDVLEKPDQLTDQEYVYMQNHAYYTYKILSHMDLGDIIHWASFHHEKLDGSGYPFGKKANELDQIDRLMACCDIYQALIEKRPYKESLTHEESIDIMRAMVTAGKIDAQIVEDMNKVFDKRT